MKNSYQGSITIFSLLSMLLVASTLLSLLEGARFWEINRLSKLQTQLAIESVFANYSTNLWNEYHLLGCKQGEMQEILIEHANSRYDIKENGMNTLIFQVEEADIKSYTLLTDGRGKAYIAAVSSYMEKNLLYETAKELYSRYEAVKNLEDTSSLDLSVIGDAIEQMEQESTETSQTQPLNQRTKDTENPLAIIKELLGKGVLELVLEDTSEISKTSLDMNQTVSKRQLSVGKNPQYEDVGWWEKVLLQQYVLTYMSNFCNEKENHFMHYEVEYLVGGAATDKENLQIVASELLFIREIANFLYLCADTGKVAAAEGLALVLVGVSANPALIEAVKMGLLTAWAFAESVLDVRALLQGKKIPLIKSDDSWTLDIDSIGRVVETDMSAEDSKWGLSYSDYLGILLLFQDENTIALRAMDVQESTMRHNYNSSEFCMDELLVQAEAEVTYVYYPIFSVLGEMFIEGGLDYKVTSSARFGY